MDRARHRPGASIVEALLDSTNGPGLPDTWLSHFFATATDPDTLLCLSQTCKAGRNLVMRASRGMTLFVHLGERSEDRELAQVTAIVTAQLTALKTRGKQPSHLVFQHNGPAEDIMLAVMERFGTVSKVAKVTKLTFKCHVVSGKALRRAAKVFKHLSTVSIERPSHSHWRDHLHMHLGPLPPPQTLPTVTDLSLHLPAKRQGPKSASKAVEALQPWLNHLTRLSFTSYPGPHIPGPTLSTLFTASLGPCRLRSLCTSEPLTNTTAHLLLNHAPGLTDVTVPRINLYQDMRPYRARCRWQHLRVTKGFRSHDFLLDLAHVPVPAQGQLMVHGREGGEDDDPTDRSELLVCLDPNRDEEQVAFLAQRMASLRWGSDVTTAQITAYTPSWRSVEPVDQLALLQRHLPLLSALAASGLHLVFEHFTLSPPLLAQLQLLPSYPDITLSNTTWPADLALPAPLPPLRAITGQTIDDTTLPLLLQYASAVHTLSGGVPGFGRLTTDQHSQVDCPWEQLELNSWCQLKELLLLPAFRDGQRVRWDGCSACSLAMQVRESPDPQQALALLRQLQPTGTVDVAPYGNHGDADAAMPVAQPTEELPGALQLLRSFLPATHDAVVQVSHWDLRSGEYIQLLAALPPWPCCLVFTEEVVFPDPDEQQHLWEQLTTTIPTTYQSWEFPNTLSGEQLECLLACAPANRSVHQPLTIRVPSAGCEVAWEDGWDPVRNVMETYQLRWGAWRGVQHVRLEVLNGDWREWCSEADEDAM